MSTAFSLVKHAASSAGVELESTLSVALLASLGALRTMRKVLTMHCSLCCVHVRYECYAGTSVHIINQALAISCLKLKYISVYQCKLSHVFAWSFPYIPINYKSHTLILAQIQTK